VSLSGLIYTYAGDGVSGFLDNVAATAGKLNNPAGITIDSQGILYFSDLDGQRVRKIYSNTPSAQPTFQLTGKYIVTNNTKLSSFIVYGCCV
jgi:hypothetical protein